MAKIEVYEKWVALLTATGKSVVTTSDLREIMTTHGLKFPQWLTKDPAARVGRGQYRVPFSQDATDLNPNEKISVVSPEILAATKTTVKTTKKSKTVHARQEEATVNLMNPTLETLSHPSKLRITTLVTDLEDKGIVPAKYKNYVAFGNFDDLRSIIVSKQFYPVFITGPSGNGKSMSVEQACAGLGREYICVSMTPETDEGDLLGNYVLIDSQMVWRDGPVTVAARRGAVLCIDEIDYGAQNLSCLQRVLEGKPFLLKKKGEIVEPKLGFQIFATANTKGKGSEDGRYMFTNVLNEAFLERFPITFEQVWAPNVIERKIIKKELETAGRADEDFAERLVTWATVVRKTAEDMGGGEVVSTRRLVHIAKAYPIFNGDRLKCITYCLNRFDDMTKKAFIDLYTKVDSTVETENTMEAVAPVNGGPCAPDATTVTPQEATV